jgi:uncharacterized protein (DUF1778 family)
MSTKRKTQPVRSADMATLTISLPADLKKLIAEAAVEDGRNVSNYVARELTKLLSNKPPSR